MTHEKFINYYLTHNYAIENNRLIINDNLILRGSNIQELPDNLTIIGYCGLYDTNVIKLPTNLIIKNGLDIENSQISEVPEELIVSDWFDIWDTLITSLPDNFKIGGAIYSNNTLNMNEKQQCELIKVSEHMIYNIKKPTEKAKTLHNLLWKL